MKKFVRKQFCKNHEEAAFAIETFRKTLTPQKCQKYINHIHKVIDVIISRDGSWSDMEANI